MIDQLDLFGSPKPAAKSNEPLEISIAEQPKPKPTPKTKNTKQTKAIHNPSEVYDTIVQHLMTHAIPPFTEFKVKSLYPHAFKWLIDTLVTSAKPHTFTDKLVVMIQVEKPSQDTDNPDGKYRQFEELHRRNLQASMCPMAIGQKPRKPKLAKGGRGKQIVVHKA